MKKLFYTFLALSSVLAAQAQQRMVLVEEFTQASCGPCASQNPAFNATLVAQTAKAISIKYQTSWPGVDPMNAHNPTQVATRVSYYGVTGVPNAFIDGNVYNGAPSGVTATNIGNRYNVVAPFGINITHALNATFDSITVTAVVTKLAAVTGTNVRLHLAVVEKTINFTSAPGTNGEKDFFSVMKRMLPSDQGTQIPVTMAVGDQLTFVEKWAMTNVYDKNQVAVVAFLQDAASKEVHQTALSAPQAVVPDVKLNSLTAVGSVVTCAANANLLVNIKNGGIGTLTSCTVRATAGGVATDFPWTGSLATGASANTNISVPLTSFGSVNVQVQLVNANTGDGNPVNDMATLTVIHPDAATTTMPAQSFISTVFPPLGWGTDGGTDGYNWARSSTGTTGDAGSSALKWYNIASGQQDALVLPNLDFSQFQAGPNSTTQLKFTVAHAAYAGTSGGAAEANDVLNVQVSANCGTSWTTLYSKGSTTGLTTTTSLSGSFTPTAAQWREETIDLTNYNGQTDLLFRFNGISGYGNNVYVDKINVTNTVTVGTQNFSLNNAVTVFPSPTKGNIGVNITLDQPQAVQVEITNMLGQRLLTQNLGIIAGGNYPFDLSEYVAGSYFVRISTENATTVKKIIKN